MPHEDGLGRTKQRNKVEERNEIVEGRGMMEGNGMEEGQEMKERVVKRVGMIVGDRDGDD